MATQEAEILDQLLPTLLKLLSLDNIKPHLRSAGVLTETENQQLAAVLNNRKEDGVKALVAILKAKGPHCGSILLSALRESASDGGGKQHRSHQKLIGILEGRMGRGGATLEGSGLRPAQNGSTTICPRKPGCPGAADPHPRASTAGVLPQPGTGAEMTATHHSTIKDSLGSGKDSSDHPGLSREPVQLLKYESLGSTATGRDRKGVENLCVFLVRESKAIRQSFADFVLNVCELLESSPTATIPKVQLALQYLGNPSTNLTKNSPKHPVFRSSITKATSIPGLLSALTECSSWFNYEMISYLAQRFGGEEGKELALQYEAQLRRYFQRLIFHCPPLSNERCLPHGVEELTIMVDWDLKDCSLQDVSIFKSTICRLLDVQPCAFVLRSIHEVPAKLTWGIPSVYLPQAVSNAMSNPVTLSDVGVQSMRLGSKVIDFPSSEERKVSPLSSGRTPPRQLSLTPNKRVLPTSVGLQPTSRSLQANKSQAGVTYSPVHAYGRQAKRSSASARAKLDEFTYHEDLSVHSLAQSPVLTNRSYPQFYFDSQEICSPTDKESPPRQPKEESVLPTSEPQSKLKHSNASTPQSQGETYHPTSPRSSTTVPTPQLYEKEGISPPPLETPQYQSPVFSSTEHLTVSPVANTAIRVAAFRGRSANIGSPMSASIVNIDSMAEGVDTGSQPATPQLQGNGGPALSLNVTLDVMLSAATEARRKRGRRKRIDLETARRLTEIQSAHVQAALGEDDQEKTSKGPQEPEPTTHPANVACDSQSERCSHEDGKVDLTTSSPPAAQDGQHSPGNAPSQDHAPSKEPELPLHSSTPVEGQSPNRTCPSESKISLQSAHSHSTISSLPSRTNTPSYTPVFSPTRNALESQREPLQNSVGFLWRVLGRASKQFPASVYVAAIATTHSWQNDELPVRKGQQFKAQFRAGNRIYAVSHQNVHGYIPYQYCRVSKKHYGSTSRMVQLSYSQVHTQSPDGVDTGCYPLHRRTPPGIEMVAIQQQQLESLEDVCVKSGERIRVLYCDDTWVYALNESLKAGFIPRACCRLTRKTENLFRSWINNNAPFQADFVVRFSQSPPLVLRQNMSPASADDPVSPKLDAPDEKHGSRVGKVMTVVRSFQPSGSGSMITITRGLRVRVVKTSGELGLVTTRSGNTFWIPFSYLRPAIKGSDDFDSRAIHDTNHKLLGHTLSLPVASRSHETVCRPRPMSLIHESSSNTVHSSSTAKFTVAPFSSSQPALSSRTISPQKPCRPVVSTATINSFRKQNLPSYPSDETLGYV